MTASTGTGNIIALRCQAALKNGTKTDQEFSA